MGLDQQKIIRASRLSLTCLFIFLITWYYQVPESAWSLITIWFVMYEYNTVGGVFTKSWLRFSGTVASAVYGMTVVYCCANDPVIDMLALVAGLFVYTNYFMGGDKTYIGTIGAVTLTIVLLNYNEIDTAILRVFNIIIGVIGSMIMIRFFYPQYARNKILGVQSIFIEELSRLLKGYLDPSITLASLKEQLLTFNHKNASDFTLFNRLINEAKIETKKAPFFIPHAIKAMDHTKILIQLFSVLVYYLSTDEIRSDPWICNNLNRLLTNLQTSQKRLLGQDSDQSTLNFSSNAQNLQNSQAIATILTDMIEESISIDKDIKKIVLIYEIYDVCIDKV